MKERTNQPALISVTFFSLHVISVRQKNVTLKMTLERMSLTMALSRPLAYLCMCVNELCRKRKPQQSPSRQSYLSLISKAITKVIPFHFECTLLKRKMWEEIKKSVSSGRETGKITNERTFQSFSPNLHRKWIIISDSSRNARNNRPKKQQRQGQLWQGS